MLGLTGPRSGFELSMCCRGIGPQSCLRYGLSLSLLEFGKEDRQWSFPSLITTLVCNLTTERQRDYARRTSPSCQIRQRIKKYSTTTLRKVATAVPKSRRLRRIRTKRERRRRWVSLRSGEQARLKHTRNIVLRAGTCNVECRDLFCWLVSTYSGHNQVKIDLRRDNMLEGTFLPLSSWYGLRYSTDLTRVPWLVARRHIFSTSWPKLLGRLYFQMDYSGV